MSPLLNILKHNKYIIIIIAFLIILLILPEEKIKNPIKNYKIEELSDNIKFNSSAIFLPNENKIKVFYNFKEKKINQLPYKDNISYEEAYIHLNKKKIESGVYNLKFQLKDKKYSSLLITNPKFQDKGDILVIVPDFTIQAYSYTPGISFYHRPKKWLKDNDLLWNGLKENRNELWLNMYRPANNRKIINSIDSMVALQNYYKLNNIEFNFISQKFLHENHKEFDLNKYKLIILFAHDEYWTDELQKIIFQSVKNGLNLLNLSGNTYWWTLKEKNDYINRKFYGRNFVNKKFTNHEVLLGTSYRFGGYPLIRKYELDDIKKSSEFKFLSEEKILQKINGLEIIKPNDNIFKGTGLKYGDIIGYQNKINKIELDAISEIKLIKDLLKKDESKKKIGNYKLKGLNNEYLATTYAHYNFPKKVGVIGRNNYFKGKIISTGMIGWAESLENEIIKKITINMIEELLD